MREAARGPPRSSCCSTTTWSSVPCCVARLAEGLRGPSGIRRAGGRLHRRDGQDGVDHWDYPRHVGINAVLFRRERLEALTSAGSPRSAIASAAATTSVVRATPSVTCPEQKHGTGHHRLPVRQAAAEVSPHHDQPDREPQAGGVGPSTRNASPFRGGSWPPLTVSICVCSSRRFLRTLRARGQLRDGHRRHLGPLPERARQTGRDARSRGRRRPQRRPPGAATAPRLPEGRGELASGHACRLLGCRGCRLPGPDRPSLGPGPGTPRSPPRGHRGHPLSREHDLPVVGRDDSGPGGARPGRGAFQGPRHDQFGVCGRDCRDHAPLLERGRQAPELSLRSRVRAIGAIRPL